MKNRSIIYAAAAGLIAYLGYETYFRFSPSNPAEGKPFFEALKDWFNGIKQPVQPKLAELNSVTNGPYAPVTRWLPLAELHSRGFAEGKVNQYDILAIIGNETFGDPFAVGGKGERGLGHFMPDTYADQAAKHGYHASFDEYAMLETLQVRSIADYLQDLLDEFNGEMDQAVKAYNIGAGNLRAGKFRAKAQRYFDKWAERKAKIINELSTMRVY